MTEVIEGRSAQEARRIVEADLARLARIEAIWSEMTDAEQAVIVAQAEALHGRGLARVLIELSPDDAQGLVDALLFRPHDELWSDRVLESLWAAGVKGSTRDGRVEKIAK